MQTILTFYSSTILDHTLGSYSAHFSVFVGRDSPSPESSHQHASILARIRGGKSIMAALVQTIPQQTGTVPVLQSRPTSSGSFTTTASSSPPSSQQQTARNSTMSWNPYTTVGSSGSYRPGHQAVTPSSPNNSQNNRQSWAPHLRPEHRTSSAPSAPQLTAHPGDSSHSVNPSAAGPVSPSVSPMHMSKDDSAIPSRQPPSSSQQQQHSVDPSPPLRPLSTVNIPSPLMNISSPTTAKPSPDRYRRGNRRTEGVAGTQPTANSAVPAVTVDDSLLASSNLPTAQPRNRGHVRVSSADDSSRPDKPQTELAKRYRRRSWGTMDNAGLINLQLHLPSSSPTPTADGQDYFDQTPQSSQKDEPANTPSAQSSNSSVCSPISQCLCEMFPSNLLNLDS